MIHRYTIRRYNHTADMWLRTVVTRVDVASHLTKAEWSGPCPTVAPDQRFSRGSSRVSAGRTAPSGNLCA